MTEFIGYHGTDKQHYPEIKKDGFKKYVSLKSLPCDLGRGAYFFIYRSNHDNPKKHALRYVKKYKPRYTDPIVLEASVVTNEILDFNETNNKDIFLAFKDNNVELIQQELKSYSKNRSFERGNLDGIVIEVMIQSYRMKVDAVLKDTYTPLEDVSAYKRSNFPNGRELCVRNTNKIKNVCIAI